MHVSVRTRLGILAVLTPAALLGAGEPGPAPRVVAAWASGPLETRVAFDRAVGAGVAAGVVGSTIALDTRRATVDRSKPALPPAGPDDPSIGTLRITGARLDDGGRTLVLAHDPHPRQGIYSLELPLGGGTPTRVAYDLTGVEAAWDNGGEGAKPAWSGWWPELDPGALRTLAQGSPEHARGLALLKRPGRLTLRTLLTLPEGRVTLRLESNRPIAEALLAGENAEPAGLPGGGQSVEFTLESTGDPTDLGLTLRTGAEGPPPALRATYRLEGEPSARPLPRDRQVVGWSPSPPPTPGPAPTPPNLSGGDRARGEALFFGEAARCSQCHQVGGKGKTVGPDLSRLAGRDPAAVYRDVAEPSATIRPDYVPYTVALKDGRVVVGIVRAEGADALRVTDTEAKTTVVRKADVEELRPSGTSIMPVGLAGAIGEAGMRDLLAFLTARPVPRKP